MEPHEVVDRFSDYLLAERRLEAETVEGCLWEVRRYLDFLSSRGSGWDRATAPEIFAYVCDRRSTVSSRTVMRTVSALRTFHGFLTYDGMRLDDPAGAIQSPKAARRLPEILTLEQVEVIIDRARGAGPMGLFYAALFELLYDCGLRISEALALKLSDLRFSQGSIRVVGKGQKARMVPIGARAVDLLNRYLRELRPRLVEGNTRCDLLFVGPEGRQLNRRTAWRHLKRIVREIGAEGATLHTFRHSYATHLLQGGADLRSVQLLLGHADIDTTIIYTNLDRKDLREAHARFHPLGSPARAREGCTHLQAGPYMETQDQRARRPVDRERSES